MAVKTKNPVKTVLKIILIALAAIVAAVLIYLLYVIFSYSRINDNVLCDVFGENNKGKTLSTDTSYTVVTQNIGFGAYTPDFTFFMDGGTQSWANSKESVIETLAKAADKLEKFNADFIYIQEVDTGSTRSYGIDEREILKARFPSYDGAFAVNYHSAFLMYPLTEPHGSSNSGIMTLSKFEIDSSVRRSLPISESFSKFLDLDRCYSVTKIPVENGKMLVLYNVHLSAYGGSDEIRAAQMGMLFSDMKAEYDAGNYCVCGGDFNHDFTGDSTKKLNGGESVDFGWAQPFPADMLPDGIIRCDDYTDEKLSPSCRNCDIPYVEGNFTVIVDGFLVSANVTVEYLENVYTAFEYSDHCPVVMKFKLN